MDLCRPFRAWISSGRFSQGIAPGFIIWAFQAGSI